MFHLHARVGQAERIPCCHGIAYLDYVSDFAITWLWPLNHIVSLLRSIWFKICHAKVRDKEIELIKHIDNESERRALEIIQKMIAATNRATEKE